MKKLATVFAVVALISLGTTSAFALNNYLEDFESLDALSGTALGDAGWLVFANVFGPDWAYWYGYGVFPAPNGSGGFSNVAVGEGGGAQGAQQIVTFSDYNNGDHANGAFIESIVFQEQTVGAGDVGETWIFEYQAKRGDLAGGSTAAAFIKTLNPLAGYATTNYLPVDMTTAPTTWGNYSISITIDAGLVGQLLQIGFVNVATGYEPSGVVYDNIWFHVDPNGVVATEDASFGDVKAMFR